MSGINIDNRMIRKGSVDAIRHHVESNGGHFPADVEQNVENVAQAQAEIEAERKRAREELRKQVAILAVAGAEKIIERSVDEA
ncbi:hypothetical protein MJO10_33890, partial [Salmonella enterica subsp. enterica serovar Anatum]|nr:hypothetical protein [Salmonella enterica subsp. enterica serovar Anatum]